MKKFSFALLALAAAATLVPAAYAGTISGDVIVQGYGDTWTTSSISFDSSTPATVPYSDGSLAVTPGTGATPSDFTFVPSSAAVGQTLFTLPNGETFTIEGILTETLIPGFLNIQGWGYIDEPGYTEAVGGFSLTTTVQGNTTSYTEDISVAPEPSSLLLLGTGLLGVGLLVRTKLTS